MSVEVLTSGLYTARTEQKTATPSLSSQVIRPSTGLLLDKVTINPVTGTLLGNLDSDFKADNIKTGVNMFGVVGTYDYQPTIQSLNKNVGSQESKTLTFSHTLGRVPRFISIQQDGYGSSQQGIPRVPIEYGLITSIFYYGTDTKTYRVFEDDIYFISDAYGCTVEVTETECNFTAKGSNEFFKGNYKVIVIA